MRLEELVLSLLVTGEFQPDVGQDLVGVHVRRRAGAALVPIDQELIVVLAGENRLGRLLDRRQPVRLHRADLGIGFRRGELDDRPRLDEPRIVIDRYAGKLEVLQCAQGLDAVVGVAGDLFRAEQILLHPRLHALTICSGPTPE